MTRKAFDHGLRPIVVINKVDRPEARCDWVLDQTFDLFDKLGASDEQLDFPVVYASALEGLSGDSPDDLAPGMEPLLTSIREHCPPPTVEAGGPLQLELG